MMFLTAATLAIASWTPATIAPADPAVRAEIEQTLAQMAAAAANADAAGYMRHVYPDDHEFLHEQKYFANDLAKKPPEAIEFHVGEPLVSDGAAEAELTMTWTMPGEKERTVTYDVRFIERDGAWLYAGEVWHRFEAPGVLVMCDEGLDELAAATVEAFNAVRSHVEEGFELQGSALPKKTQKIKLYGSMKHLQASICLSYKNGLGGWNEPNESIKLLTNRRTAGPQLRNLLAHEYGHVATFELGDRATHMPWWVLEGVAELSAEKFSPGRKGTIPRLAAEGRLAPFEEISDFENTPNKYRGLVYSQGHHMVAYLSERFGRTARNAWLTSMAQGRTIDEASREVFKIDFATLDREWRESIPKPEAEPKEEPPAKQDAKPDPAPATRDG